MLVKIDSGYACICMMIADDNLSLEFVRHDWELSIQSIGHAQVYTSHICPRVPEESSPSLLFLLLQMVEDCLVLEPGVYLFLISCQKGYPRVLRLSV